MRHARVEASRFEYMPGLDRRHGHASHDATMLRQPPHARARTYAGRGRPRSQDDADA